MTAERVFELRVLISTDATLRDDRQALTEIIRTSSLCVTPSEAPSSCGAQLVCAVRGIRSTGRFTGTDGGGCCFCDLGTAV